MVDPSTAKQVIEAILFLHEEPVRLEKISAALSLSPEETTGLLRELREEMAGGGRGLRLFEVAGGYRLGTPPELAPYLEKVCGEEGSGSLSAAATETLAIVAYKQPVTRLEIESLRGVKSEHVLDNLLRRKLIRVAGRGEGPGRPLLYGTTVDFLKYFGLKGMEDLPPLAEFPGDGSEKTV